jgi:nucleoside-diphosphate-sugar epimerase
VVNNLVGFAVTEGRVLMKSDGSPWRPLVHIEDIARAFVAAVGAPREKVHDQVLNVGSSEENYQIRDVAAIVQDVVPGSEIVLSDTAGPDIRDYRVDCSKIAQVLPAFAPQWTVRKGAEQLYDAFVAYGIGSDAFLGKLLRIQHVRSLQEEGVLGPDLRMLTTTGDGRA